MYEMMNPLVTKTARRGKEMAENMYVVLLEVMDGSVGDNLKGCPLKMSFNRPLELKLKS